jgi:DNA-directed RNA polymerase I subunit RPA1
MNRAPHRRRLIEECRVHPGRIALEKTFTSLEAGDSPEVLMTEFDKTFCSRNVCVEEMDQNWKRSIDEYQNQIIKRCMPHLFKQFAEINLQLLIRSGDKCKGSSSVDAMQMSYLLRQQELEGKQPPLVPSGRTMPSFRPFEYSPRSGGSFLSGIRPREYFFQYGEGGLAVEKCTSPKKAYYPFLVAN